METKSLVQTAVAVLVAVVVFSTVLIPVVSDAQESLKYEVEYTNSYDALNHYHYDYVEDVDVVLERTESNTWIAKVNGEPVSIETDSMVLFLSDVISIHYNTTTVFIFNDDRTDIQYGTSAKAPYTISYHNGTATLSDNTGVLFSKNSNWCVSIVDGGRYIAHNGNPYHFYTNGEADGFIIYGSTFTTGNLNTYYAYGNGELSISVDEYNGNIIFNRGDLVDGTTDVYLVDSISLEITDGSTTDTFVPYRSLVKQTVEGHTPSGIPGASAIIGVIPFLVIVGIILAVVGVAITRRYDL